MKIENIIFSKVCFVVFKLYSKTNSSLSSTNSNAMASASDVNLSDNRGRYIHAAVGTCITLAALGVIGRLVCRRLMKTKLNASDYFVILGLLAAFCEAALIFASVHVGFGTHVENLSSEQLKEFLLIFFVAELNYVLTITLTKVSILLLYRSLFPGKEFAIAVNILGGMVFAWAIACVLGTIFSCIPVNGFWDSSVHAHCISSTKFFIGNAIPNMVTDTCILLLPVRRVWQLHLSTQRKIMVSGMFLLGSFVIVASILRLVLLFNENLNDPTWGLVNAFTWSNIEVDIAVLSACLPTLKPLYQKFFSTSGLTSAGTKDRKHSKDAYAKLPARKYPREEFDNLPKSISHDTSIYTTNDPFQPEREEYPLKQITVQREFDARSGEAEV